MINKVILIGNAGKNAEIRKFLEKDRSVINFSLATNESYLDKNREWQTVTEWHNIELWDKIDRNEKKVDKILAGASIYIEGKIKYQKYENKDGHTRYKTIIKANVLRLLNKPSTENPPF